MTMTSAVRVSGSMSSRVAHSIPVRHTISIGRSLAGLKILAAHDSPEITAVLADVLTAAGAKVTQANEAAEAKMLVAWGGYDLVLLDAMVPDAKDILELIAQSNSDLLQRTVVVTGDLQGHDAELRLTRQYPAAFFCRSWLTDLVGLAQRAMSHAERRNAA